VIIGYNIDRCKDIYRFVLRNFTDNALKMQVVSSFENKAIGFNYYGSLQKAFSIFQILARHNTRLGCGKFDSKLPQSDLFFLDFSPLMASNTV
jgi:hypothetical protein